MLSSDLQRHQAHTRKTYTHAHYTYTQNAFFKKAVIENQDDLVKTVCIINILQLLLAKKKNHSIA